MALSRLAIELKKKRPFELPEEEAFLNLVRTAQWLSHGHERLLKQHDLSGATYNLLRILRGEGGDGLPCQEMASRMVTRVPDVTRLVDRLIDRGLVKRTRQDDDRRVVRVSITPKGQSLLTELDRPTNELLKRQLSHLSRSEIAELNRLVAKARESVTDPCDADKRN